VYFHPRGKDVSKTAHVGASSFLPSSSFSARTYLALTFSKAQEDSLPVMEFLEALLGRARMSTSDDGSVIVLAVLANVGKVCVKAMFQDQWDRCNCSLYSLGWFPLWPHILDCRTVSVCACDTLPHACDVCSDNDFT
jgi:hypothetical protein